MPTRWWMRIDGLPHDELMKSIELFGKYVIPRFKNPRGVVRCPEAILDDIRSCPARPTTQKSKRSAMSKAHRIPNKQYRR